VTVKTDRQAVHVPWLPLELLDELVATGFSTRRRGPPGLVRELGDHAGRTGWSLQFADGVERRRPDQARSAARRSRGRHVMRVAAPGARGQRVVNVRSKTRVLAL
jgi:hypothetical protein